MAAVTLLTTLMITSWVLTDPSNSSDTCRHPRLLFPITDKPHGGFALDLECSHSMVYSAMGLQGKEEYPAIWDVVTMDNVTQGHIFRYQTYRFPSSFRSTVFFYFLLKPYGLFIFYSSPRKWYTKPWTIWWRYIGYYWMGTSTAHQHSSQT